MKDEVLKTKDNLVVLGSARLQNPKISIREIQFMEGNRKAYILGVNNFLRGIDLEEKDYSAFLEFCNNFNARLEKFGASTIKSYRILQEFFAHESRDIALNIKNFDSLIKGLGNAIKNVDIAKINQIKLEISEIQKSITQKSALEELIKEKKDLRQRLGTNKENVEKEIETLMKSREYASLNELRANKEVVLAKIREHNSKVVHAFSVIERPLKKLTRVLIEDNNLLTRYMDNPVDALISDNNFKIIGLLQKLEKNINNYTLEFKDKKREKVLETLNGLTNEFFTDFVNKYTELNEELEKLEKGVRESEALKKENKLRYELSNVKDNLEKLNNEIEFNKKELDKIDIDKMKDNLEKEVNELLKLDVNIT